MLKHQDAPKLVFCGDVAIDPRNALILNRLLRRIEQVLIIRRVRKRHVLLHKCRRDRTERRGRNHSRREARSPSGTGRTSSLGQQRTRNRLLRQSSKLTLQLRWREYRIVIHALRLHSAISLIRQEKECLIANRRTTERASKQILMELGSSQLEEVAGIEESIA